MKITTYNINVSKIGKYNLAFVSDLHNYSNEIILNKIRDMQPDAILVSGDVIHNSSIYKNGIEFLNEASNITCVYCSLGNHEMKAGDEIVDKIKNSKATVLDNASAVFGEINIGGLTSGYKIGEKQKRFGKTPAPDLKWLESYSQEDGYKILLAHHPEYYLPYLKCRSIDLTLSGHAHGGQVMLCGHGLLAPGQGLFPKYTHGMYDGRLIVSRGIGNKAPIPRLNNPPEIICIRINGEK
jgi:predicted MPP superfamily phosphohydrolase